MYIYIYNIQKNVHDNKPLIRNRVICSGFYFVMFFLYVQDNAHNTDSLNNYVTREKSPNNELIRRIDDREDWKAMIADACSRPGT